MSDLQPQQQEQSAGQQQPVSSRRWGFAVAVAAAAVLAGVGGWYGLRRTPRAEAPPPVAESTAPAAPPAAAPPPPAAALPPLAESDPHVRGLAGRLSTTPELSAWLAAEDLVRRLTTVVSGIAEGQFPRGALPVPALAEPFQVVEREGRLYMAPQSFTRYDALARALASIDAKQAAEVYRDLGPLFERAYEEISRPGQRFEQALSKALSHLLEVRVPEGDMEVVQARGVTYAFADPALEALSPARKHLLRMGPENARALQAKLRELQAALGLTTASR